MEKEMLTVRDIAKRYGISLPRAYEIIESKGIPYIRLSERRIRIPMSSLVRWETENEINGK